MCCDETAGQIYFLLGTEVVFGQCHPVLDRVGNSHDMEFEVEPPRVWEFDAETTAHFGVTVPVPLGIHEFC